MVSQTVWGPVNIKSGNSAYFTAQFIDANGYITVPSGCSITVTYTNTSNAAQTDTVTMTLNGDFFNGTWSSTSAAKGLANWSCFATGFSTASQTGQIRVIGP